MADPFKNHLAPKEKKNGRYPWGYVAPTKDQAHNGVFLSTGDNYGVGYNTPTGREKPRSIKEGPIPQRSECRDPNEYFPPR